MASWLDHIGLWDFRGNLFSPACGLFALDSHSISAGLHGRGSRFDSDAVTVPPNAITITIFSPVSIDAVYRAISPEYLQARCLIVERLRKGDYSGEDTLMGVAISSWRW